MKKHESLIQIKGNKNIYNYESTYVLTAYIE